MSEGLIQAGHYSESAESATVEGRGRPNRGRVGWTVGNGTGNGTEALKQQGGRRLKKLPSMLFKHLQQRRMRGRRVLTDGQIRA